MMARPPRPTIPCGLKMLTAIRKMPVTMLMSACAWTKIQGSVVTTRAPTTGPMK